MTPRAWQSACIPAVVSEVRAGKRTIVSAIMGSGKSYVAAELALIAWRRAPAGSSIVLTAPRIRLVDQLAKTVAERCGAENVGRFHTHVKEPDRPIVVVCNQSMATLAGLVKCRLWIADEVHQTEAEQLHEAAALLAPQAAVGFTATAYRSNENESLRLWDSVAFRYPLADAIRDKVLVPWETVYWDGEGDKNDVNPICLRMMEGVEGPGLVNAKSIEDAENFAEFLRAAGVKALAFHSRMPEMAQWAALKCLEAGDLRCLVHVNMLSEGVDLPWLRWLCLRRRVGARVRFVQEVGRVLRCHPGKSKAVILDPYDLFAFHGITHPEAIGEGPSKPPPKEPEEDFPLIDLPPRDEPLPPAVAVDAVGAWSRRLLLCMEMEGLHVPSEHDQMDAEWRRREPTGKQLDHLRALRWHTRYLPEGHRKPARALMDAAEGLRCGVVSDMISVLRACEVGSREQRARKRHWPWPGRIEVPVLPGRVVKTIEMGEGT